MRRCLLVLIAALSVLSLSLAGAAGRLAAAELQPLEIASKSGVHVFAVEIASTPQEQATGLMFRRELPEGQGMLFDFHSEQPTSFWMKNTYIPLDMLFIRSDAGLVRRRFGTNAARLAGAQRSVYRGRDAIAPGHSAAW